MVKKRKRNRINATGRNLTSRFARLDFRILNSNAYRSLSPNDRSLLVELVMLYNGENNGSLYLSVRDAAHRMGLADLSAASRSFDVLQDLGFIQLTQDAHFCVKAAEKSRARCWRLTWQAGPGRKAPSWEFLDREPDSEDPARKRMERGLRALKTFKQSRDRGKFPVLDSDTLNHYPSNLSVPSVLDSDTPKDPNGSIQPNVCVRASATHIATPLGEKAKSHPIGWWQPDCVFSLQHLTLASLANGSMLLEIPTRKAA
ncbi:hypothetical protein [Novosphingobium aureum]|nr:hypothetical protein [Novosphingobium aureum]